MLQSTFLDMVLGVDIHFEMVPMPGPVPTPLPNPFVGMVWDPGGLLAGQAMGLAMALLSGKAPKGPVIVNCMPATTCGTNAKNSMAVPHILMPPGVSWAPMPKLPKPAIKGPPPPPGPPVAPEGDAISVFGSKTVEFMGSSAVRMGDQSMSCGEPVRLPSSTVLAIPKGLPVMTGGPPALSISDAIGALLKSKWIAGYLHDLLSRMSPGRLRNLLSFAVCFVTGHPVDVATGRVLTDHVDWALPGPLPLKFTRNYASSWGNRAGPLGHGWSHSLDQAVWAERGKIVYLDGEGRELEFDTFDSPDHVLQAGQSLFDPISRLSLKSLGQRRFEITGPDGVTHEFAPVEGSAGARRWWSRLVRKVARDGAAIELAYDRRASLEWVRDSAGRQIGFEHDKDGRLVAAKLPHPTQHGWQVHTRYTYDEAGDLVTVTDPLGHSWRFAYKQHLLVQETNRNGLSFYFAYDGYGEDAYCVRTWGDGGIYDHVIDYDKPGKATYVTNSLGHTTTYKMNVVGCVVAVTDALGGSTKYEYDERTLWKVKETNPVGGETKWEHDDRGNVVKVTGPDGAEIAIEFNQHNQPVRAIDAMKGEWQWGYDQRGHLVGRVDSIGRRVQFHWDSDSASRRTQSEREPRRASRLFGIDDPAGQHTSLTYDTQGNVASLRTPDGAETRWEYDNLGHCVRVVNAKGASQRREHDALGRVLRVYEAEGNLRELEYDAEGNVVHARDKQHDVRFTYQGMGRISSRTEAGTTVAFVYDTEERLNAIKNEHRHTYRFELGPTGQVDLEIGFDGIRRRYIRDKGGRVTTVFRPADRQSKYVYDATGRVTAVEHSDGTGEAYVYRPDGDLIEAKNASAVVTLERDLLGRVVKELVGDDWVSSDYDALGMRIRVRSSRGLDQRIARNAMGQAIGVRATIDASESDSQQPWEARIGRDVMGLEIERTLPGGVQSRWERDSVGRPMKQEVFAGGEFRRAVQYSWEVNDRLRMVVDAVRGPTRYEHDALGSLAAAIYADGQVDLRMPDAVGNLFRTTDRSDRKYGPGGQLLEATTPAGVTRYEYDAEGNLARKTEPDDRQWLYEWNGSGMLTKVVRPDRDAVTFTYDALGRRQSKTFRARSTRWIWDGNLPLHEWVEHGDGAAEMADLAPVGEVEADEISARRLKADLTARPAQGPPRADLPEPELGTAESPITWLFDPETFAPAAKLVGERRYGILTDHLGTPAVMYDAAGREVWSATIDAYGDLRDVVGVRSACPFRWPGQYEDAETGLYYNRFRYYDKDSGSYTSQDPIGLLGGLAPYQYVGNPTTWIDSLGLASCQPADEERIGFHATNPETADLIRENGFRNGTKPGRLGSGGVYLNSTPEGAIAEFKYHNPTIEPEVLTVKYNPGVEAVSAVPPEGYRTDFPFSNADSITAPSARAPDTMNTNVLNNSAKVVK